jgi:hypothetical protein
MADWMVSTEGSLRRGSCSFDECIQRRNLCKQAVDTKTLRQSCHPPGYDPIEPYRASPETASSTDSGIKHQNPKFTFGQLPEGQGSSGGLCTKITENNPFSPVAA